MDAATRRTAEALLEEVETLGREDDHEALMAVDRRIHAFVWEASGNPYLVDTLERCFSLSLRIWYVVLDRVPGLGHAVHDQTELLRAVADRDAQRARTLMRDHVLAFQREILAAFSRS
jgi:DNA-binding GntR family transcriptional regulator